VIRRLSTDATGRRAVGVQILARGGIPVELTEMPVTDNPRPLLGVLLPTEGQTQIGGEVTLVLSRGSISWSVSYSLRVHGRSYVVTLDKGTEDGLEPGHVLAIYRVVPPIRDRRPGQEQPSQLLPWFDQTTWYAPSRFLNVPDERTGIMMVFRTFDRVSYALVLSTSEAVRIGDYVRKP